MRLPFTGALFAGAVLALAAPSAASAQAAAAPAPASAAAPAFSTADTDIGTLLDNPATKAVLQKYIPQIVSNDQISMARGMTLKAVQGYAGDSLNDTTLAKIDADLAKIPAKK